MDDFGSMVRYLLTHRIAYPPKTPDLLSSIPTKPTPKRPEPVPLSEVMAECTTMLDAGNDATRTSLTNAMYHLSLYPETQTKLRRIRSQSLRTSGYNMSRISEPFSMNHFVADHQSISGFLGERWSQR